MVYDPLDLNDVRQRSGTLAHDLHRIGTSTGTVVRASMHTMYNAPRLSGVESGTLLRAEDQADACHRAACVAYGQYLSSVCMRFHNSHLPCFGPSFLGQLPKAQLGEEAVLTFSGLVQP